MDYHGENIRPISFVDIYLINDIAEKYMGHIGQIEENIEEFMASSKIKNSTGNIGPPSISYNIIYDRNSLTISVF